MPAFGALALRTGGLTLRFLQFACAIAILGIFSYFLAVLVRQGLNVETWIRAVEGMAGAAALYTLFGILLTCFLGGIGAFAIIAVILDLCFVGCFVAIAVLTRGGDNNCSALTSEDPLLVGGQGFGDPNTVSYAPTTYRACNLMKASFAMAIAAAILFVLSIPMQLAIAAHHRREKRAGRDTSFKTMFGKDRKVHESNVPVAASQKRGFFGRNSKRRDVEALPDRPSYDTQATVANGAYATEPKYNAPTAAYNTQPAMPNSAYTNEPMYDAPTGAYHTPATTHTHGTAVNY